jgi:hypothetical protein
MCGVLLLWETICCYCDYALLCDNLLLFVTMCYCMLLLWLCVTMRCYMKISSYLWLCVIMCCELLLCVTMCCYCDYVLLCAAMLQSVGIVDCVLLLWLCVTMHCFDSVLLFATMFCYAWLSVSMCENVLHVTVFLCLIMCCELLLWVAICCYCDYALLCDNLLLFVITCYCILLLWLCVTMCCYVTICCYLWQCFAMCDYLFLCTRMCCMWHVSMFDNVLWIAGMGDDLLLLWLSAAMWQSVAICDYVLLYFAIVTICVTMRCYVTISSYLWLCLAMCDNQFLEGNRLRSTKHTVSLGSSK